MLRDQGIGGNQFNPTSNITGYEILAMAPRLDLEKITGVIMANEWTDLRDGSVMKDGWSALRVGENAAKEVISGGERMHKNRRFLLTNTAKNDTINHKIKRRRTPSCRSMAWAFLRVRAGGPSPLSISL